VTEALPALAWNGAAPESSQISIAQPVLDDLQPRLERARWAERMTGDAGTRLLSHRAARWPQPHSASEWMTGVWGDEPIFDDVDQAQSILNALMMHYNAIGAELAKGRKQYRPYGWPDDDAEPGFNRNGSRMVIRLMERNAATIL